MRSTAAAKTDRALPAATMAARFAVGIDLGTTNTVVAFSPIDAAAPTARVLDIAQLAAVGEIEARPLFASALYAPVDSERLPDPFGDAPWVLGELARRRGAEATGRVVLSSKSWLAYAAVDRTAPILPWGGGDDVPRLSPVQAASRLLAHVRRVWDDAHADAPLADQDVVLTVPASFDEIGRELTLEGARAAGLAPKLLEEPQAAFYDWMARAGRDGMARLLAVSGGESLVLVVDIGGGTTDLSLIRVSSVERIARIAVGPHLLLGGDNMDLALAHACEERLAEAEQRLDAGAFAQLVSACRSAKELLLGESPPDDAPVTILGRGAGIVGAARTTRLTRQEARRIVLDGFLPEVAADACPTRARGGLLAFGLPYQRDVAITRHVAAFVARHLPAGTFPDAVLLNGGVFRAVEIAERLVRLLGRWRGGGAVTRLADVDPDLAVARGAVAYALARLGRGVRIGGGAPRGYFVGIGRDDLSPGAGTVRAVCVVPRGAEEGATYVARGRTFALAVGRHVRFEAFASDEIDAREGDVVDIDGDHYSGLPPLSTRIVAPGESELRVTIEGELTAVGTLDLSCVETDALRARRYRLTFGVRESVPEAAPGVSTDGPKAARHATAPLLRVEPAADRIDRVFGKARAEAGGREAKDLLRDLERLLGDRAQWTAPTSRAIYDVLIAGARARRRSPDHERVFWLLAGFCVRPGFGDPRDPARVDALAPLLEERLAFPAETRGWQQFWIAWRRAAGGLDEARQTAIRDVVDAHLGFWLSPNGQRKRPKKPALALDDALDMASSLERVATQRRAELGGWVLDRTWTDRNHRLWTAVGRIGARVPAYASAHYVVAPHAVERWLEHLLREKWESVPTAAQAAMRMARRTGDRARDVADTVRREVERRLVAAGSDEAWVRAVREVVPPDESEQAAFFGEALPLGLRLIE